MEAALKLDPALHTHTMEEPATFIPWAQWFAHWEGRQGPIPWGQLPGLRTAEKVVIGPSVAEFQLGESSDGRQFLRKAARYAVRTGNVAYAAAVSDFIREENRHSELLGRFMDAEGLGKIRRSMADIAFRWLRHLFPLEVSHRTLLVGELIAVPYYRALAGASGSAVLKAICGQILEDEGRHIAFQAMVLQMLRPRNFLRRWIGRRYSRILVELALDVVWFNHSDLLQRGGYTFGRLREEAMEQHEWAMAMVAGELPIPVPQVEAGPKAVGAEGDPGVTDVEGRRG